MFITGIPIWLFLLIAIVVFTPMLAGVLSDRAKCNARRGSVGSLMLGLLVGTLLASVVVWSFHGNSGPESATIVDPAAWSVDPGLLTAGNQPLSFPSEPPHGGELLPWEPAPAELSHLPIHSVSSIDHIEHLAEIPPGPGGRFMLDSWLVILLVLGGTFCFGLFTRSILRWGIPAVAIGAVLAALLALSVAQQSREQMRREQLHAHLLQQGELIHREVMRPRRQPPWISAPPAPTADAEKELTGQLSGDASESAETGVTSVSRETAAGPSAKGVSRETLPDWVTNPDVEGGVELVRSGPHATVQLAERHALDQAAAVLKARFVEQYPDAGGWALPPSVVKESGSILRQALEKSDLQVGEFSTPMYEVYLQIDPAVETALLKEWKPTVVRQRLLLLGAGLSLLTLVLGSLAAGLRIDEQTHGRRRKEVAVGTLTLWGFVGGMLLLLV